MKKRVVAVLLTAVTVLSLTGCGGTFTCELCGEETSGKKHKETVLGQEVTICNDCYKDLKELRNELGNLLGQ